jgi:DNA mismatch repair protein MSH4
MNTTEISSKSPGKLTTPSLPPLAGMKQELSTSGSHSRLSSRPQPSVTATSTSTSGYDASRSSVRTRPPTCVASPLDRRRHGSTAASGRKSRAASSAWGADDHQVICAVSEGRGITPSIGLAFLNVTTNEAVLSQFCDSQFYVKTIHKIHVYRPSTILVVKPSSNTQSNLFSIIEDVITDAAIHSLDRRYWSETAGSNSIQSVAFREDLEAIKMAIQGNFFATSSFAAVISFIELESQLTILSNSLRIRFQPPEHSMMIDVSSIYALELIQNLQNVKSKHCLFGLLNETITPMGSRMLRSNILQPSTQLQHTLVPRYDALEELTMKEDMFFEVRRGELV